MSARSTRYEPGVLPLLVTPAGALLVVPAPGGDVLAILEALDRLLPSDLAPSSIARALAGGDVAALPALAAVRFDPAGLRTLVRGAVEVRVDGVVVADGANGADGWSEAHHPLDPRSTVEVRPIADRAAAPRVGAPTLPVTTGVVFARALRSAPAVAPAVTPAAAPPSAPPPAPAAAVVDEMTTVRPRAVAPAPVPPVPVAPPPLSDPDHDGRTITAAQVQALRSARAPESSSPVAAAPRTQIALELSTGRTVPLRRRVLIGRSPRVRQVGGSANLPALVTVDDPYVSGTHLEVRLDVERVLVTDLSTNGTLLTRPGAAPTQIDPGVATPVMPGDVLTLSKGLTIRVVTSDDGGAP